MAYDFVDINYDNLIPDGRNMGALSTRVWIAKADDVLTWPTFADPEDSTYATALVLKSGKTLKHIYITPNTGSLNSPDQGEIDGISQKVELKFFIPGNSESLRKLQKLTNNRNLIFIVQDAEQRYFMVGNEQFPAVKIASEGHNTGETTESRKGASFLFTQIGSHGPVPELPEQLIPFPQDSGSGSGS